MSGDDLTTPLVVTAAVIERDGAYLLTRRLEGTHLEGLWEFPGGKCEPGETLEACLGRELVEELELDVRIVRRLLVVRHAYPEKLVELHFFECAAQGRPVPQQGQECRWVPAGELFTLPFPEADRELIAMLAGRRR